MQCMLYVLKEFDSKSKKCIMDTVQKDVTSGVLIKKTCLVMIPNPKNVNSLFSENLLIDVIEIRQRINQRRGRSNKYLRKKMEKDTIKQIPLPGCCTKNVGKILR